MQIVCDGAGWKCFVDAWLRYIFMPPGCSRCGKRLLADDLSTLFGIPDPAQLPWTDRNSPLLGGSGATPATGGSLTTPQVPITQPPTSPKTFGGVAATGGARERRASWIEFRGSWTSIAGRLGPRRFRTEGPGRVALRPVRERDLALARQLFGPQFPILRARQRYEEGNEIIDLSLC
jgi:hypothetical protein